MNIPTHLKRLVYTAKPEARFINYGNYIDGGNDSHNIIGKGLYFVSLYDEKTIASIFRSLSFNYSVIIQSNYTSSFHHNLLLCWIYIHRQSKFIKYAELNSIIKHNFKKFFAEQLLINKNTIFSRTIFLETLLYEQKSMNPIFEAKSHDSELNYQLESGTSLMSSFIILHELGHLALHSNQQIWNELLQNNQILFHLSNNVQAKYSALFFEEFKCDTIAVITCLKEYTEGSTRTTCLRSIVFGFVVFAIMSSLADCAKYTTELNETVADIVDFSGLKKHELSYDYAIGIGINPAFIERAQLIIELCQAIAEQEGLVLFGEDGPMSLPKTILADLMACSDTIMDNDDVNSRAMSRLVAEALHEHPDGIEFLYMRSKTFTGPSLD